MRRSLRCLLHWLSYGFWHWPTWQCPPCHRQCERHVLDEITLDWIDGKPKSYITGSGLQLKWCVPIQYWWMGDGNLFVFFYQMGQHVTETAWGQAYNYLEKLKKFLEEKIKKIGLDSVRTCTRYWTQEGIINCKTLDRGQVVMCLFYTSVCYYSLAQVKYEWTISCYFWKKISIIVGL